jgi:hypothetical protein
MAQHPKFPTTPLGPHAMIPFMDANHKRQIANTVFEMAGGVQRLAHEADKDFRWFIESVWVKTMPRGVTAVDSGGGAGSVDDLIDRVDRLENGGAGATIINGQAKEHDDAA